MSPVQRKSSPDVAIPAMVQLGVSRRLAVSLFSAVLLVALATMAARLSIGEEVADRPAASAFHEVRVGIANHLKVAHWGQVQVEVNPLLAPRDSQLAVTAPDNDGVPAIAAAPLREGALPDSNRFGTIYTNVGRLGAPITISLSHGTKAVGSLMLTPDARDDQFGFIELPVAAELLMFLGPTPPQVLDAHTVRDTANGHLARRAVCMESISELPEEWFGYDAVDLAVLTVGDGGPVDKYCRNFADDAQRFGAFVRWIELGGRLVIFCNGQNATELIGPGRALAKLLPGKLADVVSLPQTERLEHFAGTETPITTRQPIRVPRLVEVEGQIELYEGRQSQDLPLVVRSPRGLGEIAFVAIDPSQPPFAEWPGRRAFVDAVMRPYLTDGSSASASPKLVTRGYNDLSGALRQRLGRSFAGVAPISFSLVTVIAIGYLLVLGPLDYFVTQRWLKQPWAAWITFPLVVMLFGGFALGLAQRRDGGGGRRVNQLELVDVDVASGQARGTVWSAVFSPRAVAIDLRLDAELLSNTSGRAETRLHSWALPGAGIGGTQSGRKQLGTDAAYRYGEHGDELFGVPILKSGTKSLLGRWTAPVGHLVVAQLANEDGLVTGSLENHTGHTLRNARLYHGEWGYRLGTLADGARIDVGEELRPRGFKTIVTQDSLRAAGGDHAEAPLFVPERASLKEILNVMMFYDAVGRFGFAQLQNRLQAYCDLSRMPMLGRAVLVADVETAGSRLVDPESGEVIGDEDSAGVVYRFVLPVREAR